MIYEGQSIQVTKEAQVAELKFNSPTVNVLNKISLKELREAIEKIKVEPGLKGLMLTSEHKEFIMGADITEFLELFNQPPEDLEEWLMVSNKIMSDIEDLDYPTVTAINGFCLGGGFEVALTTNYRVMSQKAKVGLPETKLGLFPGFGGTVRLSRLVGADNAIEWIAGGKQYGAEDALKIGAVDAVVEAGQIKAAALALLNRAIEGRGDWKARQTTKKSALKLNRTEAGMAFETSKAFVAGKAGRHYPSAVKAIEVMQQGAALTRDEALKIEAKGFVEMAKTPTATSLVKIFLGDQGVKKMAKKWKGSARPVKRAAVLGAGIMGGGVAYQSASKGIPIVMKDINEAALELGMGEATKLLAKLNKRGKMDAVKMAQTLAKIRPTLSLSELADVDAVVEAVVENIKVKKSVLKEVESAIGPNAILGSNTSTISITELAKDLDRPENFCGIHFFNPVHKMPLVEVIRGEKTSDEAIGTMVGYASAMGKIPIVVNDCPGFLVNRVLFPYLGGFCKLVHDGVDYERIDKVMEKFGWPMGPAYLLDVVGIDTAYHASEVMSAGFPERMTYDYESAIKVAFENKLFGQKNGNGFYTYGLDKKGRVKKSSRPETLALLKSIMGKDGESISDEDIIDRMMLPMLIEASHCLTEKIVNTPLEVDMGLIYGLGFPPFRGGLCHWASTVGLNVLNKKAEGFASLGPLYEITEQMKTLAKANKGFF